MPTANPYDAIAYPSASYRLTHPDRLACQGRLFGLSSAEPQRCRYLELGCGAGTNLLAMAAHLPGSQFLGIDLAAAPIAEAQAHAAELGLANVTFSQGDIAGLPGRLGTFDYVAAHGVFSWVPLEVRHALLELCARHLSPHGVAYISYNALPGCHLRQMVREMLRYHVRDFADPHKRQEQSRSLMRFLVAAGIGPEPYATVLRAEAQRVLQAPMGLTAHDDLADINQPCYFHEFAALAQEHRLQFLAEAALADMSGLAVAPEVREAFAALDGDLLQKEQYLDFMRGRSFRQTLLCHATCVLERLSPPSTALSGLFITSDATIDARAAADAPGDCTYRRGEALSITLSTAPANSVVQGAIAAWPGALSVSQIRQLIASRHPQEPLNPDALAAMIWDLAHSGLIELRLAPAPCVDTISERPCVSRIARWQARTANEVTNLHHAMVHLDGALLGALVPLLDGTRTVAELACVISTLVLSGTLPGPPGVDLTDAAALHAAVEQGVGNSLERLRRMALLQREPGEGAPRP